MDADLIVEQILLSLLPHLQLQGRAVLGGISGRRRRARGRGRRLLRGRGARFLFPCGIAHGEVGGVHQSKVVQRGHEAQLGHFLVGTNPQGGEEDGV